jgi:hypothetical protein
MTNYTFYLEVTYNFYITSPIGITIKSAATNLNFYDVTITYTYISNEFGNPIERATFKLNIGGSNSITASNPTIINITGIVKIL